uniref:Uncharacterized protein n=1 Tax=Anguilla anguilla TaxID=7936 RepID=A0A0E9QK65_ANGAN
MTKQKKKKGPKKNK